MDENLAPGNNIETMAIATLNEVLQKFYLEVRKQNGSEYKPDSIKVVQAALERPLSAHKYPYSLINSCVGCVECESQRTANPRIWQETKSRTAIQHS